MGQEWDKNGPIPLELFAIQNVPVLVHVHVHGGKGEIV